MALGFAGAMAMLHLLGRGTLAAPPLGSLHDLAIWATEREPDVVAMVLVRLLALALGYHLLFTTVLAVVGRVVHAPRLVTVADAMTLPIFRSAAGRLAGLALSASTVLGSALPSASASPTPAAARSVADPLPPSADVGPALIERVALAPELSPPSEGSTATIRSVPPASAPETPRGEVSDARPAPTLHRVQPGDHLWGIAEEAVRAAIGRPPSDAEVDPFWRQVILANPDLVDPDLIFPGQLVVVPPVPRLPG